MNRHLDFAVAIGMQIYFCDPHSLCRCPSGENTNGLLRQFFPRGIDLSIDTRADLGEAEGKLSGRPRKSLDWRKPSERLAELIALAP